jgi:hypothetical protein
LSDAKKTMWNLPVIGEHKRVTGGPTVSWATRRVEKKGIDGGVVVNAKAGMSEAPPTSCLPTEKRRWFDDWTPATRRSSARAASVGDQLVHLEQPSRAHDVCDSAKV